MEKIIAFAKSISKPTSPRQSPYDWFYFICVAAMLGLIALVVYLSLKDSKKTLNACYVVSAALMWAGELYKQFVYTFAKNAPSYSWYSFPFQFCSMPLYTYVVAAILKKGKVYDAISAFNATYCLFAGLLVMIAPESVVGKTTCFGIVFQSLLHHVLMVVTGVAALCAYAKDYDLILYRNSFFVFSVTIVIAEILNFLLPAVTGQKVNMFFIGPYIKLNFFVPFLNAFPYPIFVLLYVLVFSEIAAGIMYAAYKFSHRVKKRY